MNKDSKVVICPDCKHEKVLEADVVVGDIIECEECGTEVEVLSLEPLKYQELVEEK
jgi:alpha-aminoadipate carrier protein LysW